jgi:hypothetical protein
MKKKKSRSWQKLTALSLRVVKEPIKTRSKLNYENNYIRTTIQNIQRSTS